MKKPRSKRTRATPRKTLSEFLTFVKDRRHHSTQIVCANSVVALLVDFSESPEFATNFARNLARDAGAKFIAK